MFREDQVFKDNQKQIVTVNKKYGSRTGNITNKGKNIINYTNLCHTVGFEGGRF